MTFRYDDDKDEDKDGDLVVNPITGKEIRDPNPLNKKKPSKYEMDDYFST